MEPIPTTSKKHGLLYYSSSMNSGYRPGLMPAFPGNHSSMSKIRALTKLLLCATASLKSVHSICKYEARPVTMD
jgi:hypothetical protein